MFSNKLFFSSGDSLLFTDACPCSMDFYLSLFLPTFFFCCFFFLPRIFLLLGIMYYWLVFSQKGSVKIPRFVKFFESNLRTTFGLKISGQLNLFFFCVASLTETCSFGYGLKDHFPLHKLVIKVVYGLIMTSGARDMNLHWLLRAIHGCEGTK